MKLISKKYTGRQLMNPQREYVPAAKTNVAETFKRIREQQEREEQKQSNVTKLKVK